MARHVSPSQSATVTRMSPLLDGSQSCLSHYLFLPVACCERSLSSWGAVRENLFPDSHAWVRRTRREEEEEMEEDEAGAEAEEKKDGGRKRCKE
eukprot:2989838-Pyramimonas_sp.AAC.1